MFGESNCFAWLPAVPHGEVRGRLTIERESEEVVGAGYHDHNWGFPGPKELMHHWFWGRAHIGSYTIIAAQLSAQAAYGNADIPILMIAENGSVVAGEGAELRYEFADEYIEPTTGVPVPSIVACNADYGEGKTYRITFNRKRTTLARAFRNKSLVPDGIRNTGAYACFAGDVQLERIEGEELVEHVTGQGVWEFAHFGH